MAAQLVIRSSASVNRIVSMYKKGKSLAEIAQKYSVAVTTIRNYLIREGVTLRSRGGRKTQ